MMTDLRHYRIGGVEFSLSGPAFAQGQTLRLFRCPPEGAQVQIGVEVVDMPVLPEGAPLHRELFADYYAGGRVVSLEDGRVLFSERKQGENQVRVQIPEYALQYYGSHMALRILDLPRRLLKCGGVFLHASCIAVGGRAVLFTAPSGGGKSTQAELWRKFRGAQIINGDRTLLRKLGGVWYAFGSPYCGTSGICRNAACPVEAIVLLRRGGNNTIRSAPAREALATLLGGFTYDTWSGEQTHRVLALAEELMGEVPMLCLDCTPDESAVRGLEDMIWPQK